MSTLHVTVGLPASGKTRWAKEQVKKSKGKALHTSRDDIRLSLFGYDTPKQYRYSGGREELVTKVQRKIVRLAIAEGKDVYIADTNLNPSVQRGWMKFAADNNVEIVFHQHFLDVHPDVCIDRDSRRRDSVGKDVIARMVEKYPQYFTRFDKKEIEGGTVQQMPMYDRTYSERYDRRGYFNPASVDRRRKAIIVDIDGTVARMTDRSPYDYTKVSTDALHEDVADLIETYARAHDALIIFLSGRDGSCYEDTYKWIEDHFGPQVTDMEKEWILLMRTAGDTRDDRIIKEEIFWNEIAMDYIPICAFDDRDRVVAMWRQIGLRCYQVAHGYF